jgi:hypothetical protein
MVVAKVLQICGDVDGDWGEFMWRVGFLGKWRSITTNLGHGWKEGCLWKHMVGFQFFHFLSGEVISLKGTWMTWWFKCNPFPWWKLKYLRWTQVVHIWRSLVAVWYALVGRMCRDIGIPNWMSPMVDLGRFGCSCGGGLRKLLFDGACWTSHCGEVGSEVYTCWFWRGWVRCLGNFFWVMRWLEIHDDSAKV